MFYSLTGKINRIDDNMIAINVHDVAYEVVCSLNSIDDLRGSGDKTVYTYLYVREDTCMLFGFSSLEEKRMFLNLISVSGIGPKMAISILSGMSPKMLAGSIVNGNVSLLTKIKGLGKKTAELIVLKLKEKMEDVVKVVDNPMDGFSIQEEIVDFTREMADAVSVLVELGIKKEEATKLVKAKATKADKTEDIIKKCL